LNDNGDLLINGWGKDLEKYVHLNHEKAIVPWLPNTLSYYKLRAWNFMIIYTPEHVIQFHLAKIPICLVSIKLYNRKDGKELIANRRI
jgi:hypothetical protein